MQRYVDKRWTGIDHLQKLQPKFTLCLFWAIWLATQKISTNHNAQNYRSKTFIGKFSFWLKPWGLFSIRLFICKLQPFCCKLWNLGKLWANLLAKFGRSYKSVIYGSVKFYGTGPWWWFMWKRRRTRRLFLYFCLFNTVDSIKVIKSLPMTVFEPRTFVVWSDHSTNWATTSAQTLVSR